MFHEEILPLDLSQYRPLYAPKDFLDVLFSIRDPSFKKQLCVIIYKYIDLSTYKLIYLYFLETKNIYHQVFYIKIF